MVQGEDLKGRSWYGSACTLKYGKELAEIMIREEKGQQDVTQVYEDFVQGKDDPEGYTARMQREGAGR